MSWRDKIAKHINGLNQEVPLDKYATIKLGGAAEFLVEVGEVDELVEVVALARKLAVPYRVLGFGSNIIISDKGFAGLIIINRTKSLSIDADSGRVIAASGVALSRLILEAAGAGLGGMEALYGIPGSVGGAVVVNAGTHGVSVGQHLKSASVMISSDKIARCPESWFGFEYRRSKRLKYKKSESPPILLNVIFQLQRRQKESILEDISRFDKWRREHQPIGRRTSGSVFVNPVASDKTISEADKQRTAGYLLDQAGAKKLRVGRVRVSRIHANWIENEGGATALDARMLIEKMRQAVWEKFSVELVEEVEYLGDWDDFQIESP